MRLRPGRIERRVLDAVVAVIATGCTQATPPPAAAALDLIDASFA